MQIEAFGEAVNGNGGVFPLESSRRNQAAIDALFEAGRTGDWVPVA